MNKITETHFYEDNIGDIDGISLGNALAGEKVDILQKGYFDSDHKMFHFIIDTVTKYLLCKYFQIDNISSFLILIHFNNSADIYLNNIPIKLKIKNKRALNKGESVSVNDIIDILSLNFYEIEIKEDDKIIFCFKKGWKFGLYIDLTKSINIEDLEISLGTQYKLLSYKELYDLLSNIPKSHDLFKDGWFPFFQLLPYGFVRIASIYKTEEDSERRRILLENYLDEFNSNKLITITDRWWSKKILFEKKLILESGINSYFQNNVHGYISCIKTLYSEIEGIIRIIYFNENKQNPKFNDIKKYILQRAKDNFSSENTLGFPDIFFEYFNDVIFKDFNLKDGKVDLSRHSASHGVAKESEYTRIRAFQAIMTIDQIYYYLP